MRILSSISLAALAGRIIYTFVRGLLLSFTSSDILIMKWISSVVISANGVDSRLVQSRVNGLQGCVQ